MQQKWAKMCTGTRGRTASKTDYKCIKRLWGILAMREMEIKMIIVPLCTHQIVKDNHHTA